MPDFAYLFRQSAPRPNAVASTPERAQQNMLRWLTWMRELEQDGHLKNRGLRLEPKGRIVRAPGAQRVDGLYADAQDVVGGYLVIEATDLDHAVALSSGCPIFETGGSVEVRPVMP